MSAPVREEDRQKTSSTSKGLGLAAAAIGVGVGAAVYYFFTKQPDEADRASSSSWTCEEQQAFKFHLATMSESDYDTVSEHTTSDTSIDSSYEDSSSSTSYHSSLSSARLETSETDSAEESIEPNSSVNITVSSDSSLGATVTAQSFTVEPMRAPVEASNAGSFNVGSDTEMEWDVTNYSLDVPRSEGPRCSPIRSFVANVKSLLSPHSRKSRERRWSLEECSICCEVMLNNQELKTLSCSHHFHAACVRPWLEEHQTCPNCRKAA